MRGSPLLFPAIQAGDSKRERRPGGFGETGALHSLDHFTRRRETFDRGRKISVGTANARNPRAHAGQNLFEINSVEHTHQSLWLAEVENTAFPFGTQHANDLA